MCMCSYNECMCVSVCVCLNHFCDQTKLTMWIIMCESTAISTNVAASAAAAAPAKMRTIKLFAFKLISGIFFSHGNWTKNLRHYFQLFRLTIAVIHITHCAHILTLTHLFCEHEIKCWTHLTLIALDFCIYSSISKFSLNVSFSVVLFIAAAVLL